MVRRHASSNFLLLIKPPQATVNFIFFLLCNNKLCWLTLNLSTIIIHAYSANLALNPT